MNHILETVRLILRPWEEDDAPALYRLASDPAVGPAAGWPPHESEEQSREIIRTVFSAPGIYAVVPRGQTAPIGCCGLVPASDMCREGEAEIGYWLGRDYWGRGIISEAVEAIVRHAFDDLGKNTLIIGFFDGNDKSRRVAEKCGFRPYCSLTRPGNDRSEHFYKLTKDEYRHS